MMATLLPAAEVARVIHETHRAYQAVLRDPCPSQPWDTLDCWQRETVTDLVTMIRQGWTPEMTQDIWVRRMEGAGWTLGAVKDPARKVHPKLLRWEDLPDAERKKVLLAFRIVYVLDFEGE
jgi:hypothetical protein